MRFRFLDTDSELLNPSASHRSNPIWAGAAGLYTRSTAGVWPSAPVPASALSILSALWGQAAWARCIARATRSSIATSHQSPARGVRERSRAAGALPARSASPRLAEPPEHRGTSTASKRRTASRALVMELVEGEDLSTAHRARADPARRGAADRAADRRGAGSGARARHHPPRSEAGEHQGPRRRHGQGARLRARQGDGAGLVRLVRRTRRSRRRSRRRR